METVNQRIAWLIAEKYDGNRSKFAREVGITPAYAAQIYSGERVPSDRTIADISRQCDVDRIWLETGVGEPFREPSPEEEIQKALAQALGGSEESKARLIRAVANLPDELAEKAIEVLLKIAEDLK